MFPKYGKQITVRSEWANLGVYVMLSDLAYRLLIRATQLSDGDGNVDMNPEELALRMSRPGTDLSSAIEELKGFQHIETYRVDGRTYATILGHNEKGHPNYQPTHPSSATKWRNPLPPWQEGPVNSTQRAPRSNKRKEDSSDERPDERRGVPTTDAGDSQEARDSTRTVAHVAKGLQKPKKTLRRPHPKRSTQEDTLEAQQPNKTSYRVRLNPEENARIKQRVDRAEERRRREDLEAEVQPGKPKKVLRRNVLDFKVEDYIDMVHGELVALFNARTLTKEQFQAIKRAQKPNRFGYAQSWT